MHNDAAVRATKAELRKRFLEARGALGEDDYAQASQHICRRIMALPEIADAETVSVYWPILVRREADTRPLIRELVSDGRRVVLPVVVDSESAPEMGHVAFSGEANLRPNRWGLLEPAGEPFPADRIDAVVAPALGAGRNLHRVGYGGGYYDSFLRHSDAPAIGAVFDVCLVDTVPSEDHDVPLHAVVTERETIRARSEPQRNSMSETS